MIIYFIGFPLFNAYLCISSLHTNSLEVWATLIYFFHIWRFFLSSISNICFFHRRVFFLLSCSKFFLYRLAQSCFLLIYFILIMSSDNINLSKFHINIKLSPEYATTRSVNKRNLRDTERKQTNFVIRKENDTLTYGSMEAFIQKIC